MFGFLFLILLLSPTVIWLTGSGYFNMHDDLQVMRLFEMVRCFNDGQIPCRWSPDMTNGYGQAMFNFYSAFPYYLGYFYKLIFSVSYLGTVKFLFAFALITGGIGMFLLAKEFWGYMGGLLSAVLYTYAPYHAVDIYVRGALAESFALAILPFVWLYAYKVITDFQKKYLLVLTFSLFILFTTHNISMMIYAPFTLVWIFFWIIRMKKYRSIINLGLAGLMGLGMAAFFIIPAIFEQNLVDTSLMTSVYYEYIAHYVTLNQLFISRFWGDGGSIFGTNDGMSFAIGWPHWWNLFIIIPLAFLWYTKRKKINEAIIIFILVALFFLTAYLTHSKSTFIWQRINLMTFIQFPWRFLGLSIFFISLASGAVGKIFFFVKYPLIILLISLTLILNLSYFTPVHYSRQVTDQEKLSGLAFILQQKGGATDYVPKGVRVVPEFIAPSGPNIISGSGQVTNYIAKSNGFSLNANLTDNSQIVFPYIYFPNWRAKIDGKITQVETDGAHNVIKLSVPGGEHIISVEFYNTPVRTLANTITLISFIFILGYIYRFRREL